jgi:methyl-accepting chemotaxis protein
MSQNRTSVARELHFLSNNIAKRLEDYGHDESTRATAASTLRTLADALVSISESADDLEEKYEQAMKLAKQASALADKLLPAVRIRDHKKAPS